MVGSPPERQQIEWSLHGFRCLIPTQIKWLRVEVELHHGEVSWRLEWRGYGWFRHRRRLEKLAWIRVEGGHLRMWFVDQPRRDSIYVAATSPTMRQWLADAIRPPAPKARPPVGVSLRALQAIHQRRAGAPA